MASSGQWSGTERRGDSRLSLVALCAVGCGARRGVSHLQHAPIRTARRGRRRALGVRCDIRGWTVGSYRKTHAARYSSNARKCLDSRRRALVCDTSEVRRIVADKRPAAAHATRERGCRLDASFKGDPGGGRWQGLDRWRAIPKPHPLSRWSHGLTSSWRRRRYGWSDALRYAASKRFDPYDAQRVHDAELG